MFGKRFTSHLNTVLAIIWFVFTFSLVLWWWIFLLVRLNPDNATSMEQLKTSHRMFAWEGSILLAAILLGGVSLVVFSFRDRKRHERLRFFFSTFSHDIKTSIARLRLQAEVLEEELPNTPSPVLKRLIADIQRLDLQLENSLLIANMDKGGLLKEIVSVSSLLSSLRNEFPELTLELERDAIVHGDRRALISIFKNLFQNSVLHGKATSIRIKTRALTDHRIEMQIQDDGLGFKGPVEKLGSDILKSQDTRSNGIGLLITSRLLHRMNGRIRFESYENDGFKSLIELEGHLK